jgi:phosphoglycolate phosphatase
MKDVKVVGFDCDGVIFDTKSSNRAYYNDILSHLGKPQLNSGQLSYVHAHTLEESLAYLFGDEKSLAEAHAYRRTMNYREFISYIKLEPELLPLLKKIRPKINTAIATNRTGGVNRLLTEFGLNEYFDLVVTSSDVEYPKPHPGSLLKILEHFQIKPYQAVYVGDSHLDEEAAKSAGMPLVAFRNKELSSKYHIENLKELEDILEL